MKNKQENIDDSRYLDVSENVVEIDENALDREWCNQSQLALRHALKLAEARKDLDYAKADLDVVDSELDRKVRRTPEVFGIEKITEGVVQGWILRQKEHAEANKALIEAKYKVNIIQAVVDAIEHRKKALENLVQLHLASYFSEPKERGDAKGKMRDVERKTTRRPLERGER